MHEIESTVLPILGTVLFSAAKSGHYIALTISFVGKKMDARGAAKTLFMAGMAQQEIAKLLRRSTNTISDWKKKDGWEHRKRERDVQETSCEDSIRDLIAYQLAALQERKEQWIRERKEGENPKLIERGDIDALQKLFTTIKAKERTWTDIVFVLKDFMVWLQNDDLEVAKLLAPKSAMYLEDKRNE